MKIFTILFFSLACNLFVKAQWIEKNQKKIITNTSVFTLSTSSQFALYNMWYKEFPSSSFHFFNDSKDWGYMDKIGHTYSSYTISNYLFNIYKWSGYNDKTCLFLSSGISFLYQLNIEMMDGFSDGWGFSCSDLVANCLGNISFIMQKSLTVEPIFFPKFSSSFSPYASLRPNILGDNFSSRILKDYNGQTYWIGIKSKVLFKGAPDWLLFSFGYSINERLVGHSNYFENQGVSYNSYPQFIFSLDVDLSSMKTNSVVLNTILSTLNSIKIPFPAMAIEKSKINIYPVYF